MSFDLTNLTGSSDILGLFSYANEVTSDAFGLIILFVIFVVFFGSSFSRNGEADKAFLLASFTTMISSWLMYAMGLVGVQISVLMLALTLIGAFIVGRSSKK